MKRMKMTLTALVLGVVLMGSYAGAAYAAHVWVYLTGSGPVYSNWLNPSGSGGNHMTLTVTTKNNLNVGYDVYRGNGQKVAGGTVKDKGTIKRGITDNGGKYRVRLRCQEPWWNDNKCNAEAKLDDHD
ncbi:hypothetical protein [Salinithrix halophila]|uniref:Uncharacterized protein n=1 Tax=Salinithrix halophila TaxID=1485204 RepID=A0ABV8JM88_9BACL